jgi:large subunit ribosomal protein L9
VERAMVRMPAGPIKQVGDTQVQVQLHTDVVVSVNISVLGES